MKAVKFITLSQTNTVLHATSNLLMDFWFFHSFIYPDKIFGKLNEGISMKAFQFQYRKLLLETGVLKSYLPAQFPTKFLRLWKFSQLVARDIKSLKSLF